MLSRKCSLDKYQSKLMDFLSGLKSVLIINPEFGLKNVINS